MGTLYRPVLYAFIAAILFACVSTSPGDGRNDVPFIGDDTEYRIFAAILNAPARPQQPRPGESDLRYSMQPRYPIPGTRTGYHMVRDMTVQAPDQPSYGPESDMLDDFNRKRSQRVRLDKARLLAALPPGNPITLLAEEEFQAGVVRNKAIQPRTPYPFATGIVGFSRVGFNGARTKAFVVVDWMSKHESGRYRIKLLKSPENGQWEISYVWA